MIEVDTSGVCNTGQWELRHSTMPETASSTEEPYKLYARKVNTAYNTYWEWLAVSGEVFVVEKSKEEAIEQLQSKLEENKTVTR